jgi:hypothetical protein
MWMGRGRREVRRSGKRNNSRKLLRKNLKKKRTDARSRRYVFVIRDTFASDVASGDQLGISIAFANSVSGSGVSAKIGASAVHGIARVDG